jgi:hypothetical protein
MKLHKYSEDQFRKAVIGSTSMRQVLQKLGVASYGGNYDVLRKAIRFSSWIRLTSRVKPGIKAGNPLPGIHCPVI